MSDTGQRTAEFLAVVIEKAELRQLLAEVQHACVELAVDAGEQHASARRYGRALLKPNGIETGGGLKPSGG